MCTHLVQPVCTSLSSLLFILLFIKSHYTVFAHLICFALFNFILLHILLFISLFYLYIYIYIYICSCVVLLLIYKLLLLILLIIICILLHCPLSGPDLIYISLLIIPCIIYYVTNKETLTLGQTQGPWPHQQGGCILGKPGQEMKEQAQVQTWKQFPGFQGQTLS